MPLALQLLDESEYRGHKIKVEQVPFCFCLFNDSSTLFPRVSVVVNRRLDLIKHPFRTICQILSDLTRII